MLPAFYQAMFPGLTYWQAMSPPVDEPAGKRAPAAVSPKASRPAATVDAAPQDAAAAQKEMTSLLARSVASPDAAYKSYQETITQEACASFAELHNTTSPEQRKKAVDVLAGYEQDFKTLVSQR